MSKNLTDRSLVSGLSEINLGAAESVWPFLPERTVLIFFLSERSVASNEEREKEKKSRGIGVYVSRWNIILRKQPESAFPVAQVLSRWRPNFNPSMVKRDNRRWLVLHNMRSRRRNEAPPRFVTFNRGVHVRACVCAREGCPELSRIRLRSAALSAPSASPRRRAPNFSATMHDRRLIKKNSLNILQ